MLSLETAAQGATSWVHVDVREHDTQYKDSRFYAVTAVADGDPMLDIATREGRLPLLPAVACKCRRPPGWPPVAAGNAPPQRPPPRPPKGRRRQVHHYLGY
jgi:hypothetical protein